MNPGPLLALPILLLAIALLWRGADWVVRAAVLVARRLGMSDLVIGLTVVAFGTSAPEFLVTLVAALQGRFDVSVGNVVGSNILNTGLILGLCAAVWTLPASRALARRDVPVLAIGTAATLFLLRDQVLGRIDGALMFVALLGYLIYLVRRRAGQTVPSEEPAPGASLPRNLALLALGLVCIVGGAHLLVESATSMARSLGASDWQIGVTIVAGGTSLPELATSLLAARRGRTGLISGNLIGSDLFNLLGVLGLAAMLQPLRVDDAAVTGLVMMLAAVILLALVLLRGNGLTRPAGALLIAVALTRWARDILLAG